ncbi:SDR family NAD(P)-dependent oxidoreductase [Bacillus atrophaeus]|uniref:SDR family NAD(P)-dependent oxidoreductase n=1 Tax=Bacillus atrophaeus TaxID=1452 RepID=UPI0022830F42|nr:SDR family NAD(P)-dependent oxidoreductase [Bacillus atrophaeus]MCY9109399.1 SDR family NAD(P)-dependent oxidoreductase [Bacillus atrophaeus]
MKKDIAIIGIACRFPGADNPEEFWLNLENGVNSIKEIPQERWDLNKYYSPNITASNKSISKWCGLIENIDQFDHRFFQISPREAKQMDPQQRLLMEQTHLCMEDAGVPLSKLQKKQTSVHVGVMSNDYREEVTKPEYEIDSYTSLGNMDAILANRISYMFGLSGVSSVVNSACASSLVAVHEAKTTLENGESDYAFASGINLNLHPWKYISFSKSRMLSPDGQCKTFDKNANGYVPGDGIGVLLLQRLDDALKDGNHIYGIVKGSAVNHGGRAVSMTAPRVEAQKQVILSAYEDAKVNPETVTYWEAHGTGTSLGDPIEVESATQAVREYSDQTGFCQLGSVKTNIGHLESAAGMAGLIKVLMMIRYRKIPKLLNLQSLNPIIDFTRTPFKVADQLSEWEKSDSNQPYRASVSSFGFGGVNSHVVVEEFMTEHVQKENNKNEISQMFALSAKNESSLQNIICNWKSYISSPTFKETSLESTCKTQLISRGQFGFRIAHWVNSKEEIINFLNKAEKEIQSVNNKPWTIYVGNLDISGYEDIKEWRPFLKDIRHQILALGGEKLWASFRREKWSSEDSQMFSVLVGYLMVTSLKRAGFSPQIMLGEKTGAYLNLVLSEMMSLDTVFGLINGKVNIHAIQLKRPIIPLFDPVRKQMIVPYRITANYLKNLCEEVEVTKIPEDVFNEVVEKARQLESSQFTFKRNLQEWNNALTVYNYNITELLEAEAWTSRERWLLYIVVTCAMNKLNRKWELTEQSLWNNPGFQEVVELIQCDVIPQELAVELFMVETPNYDRAALIMENRQNKLKRIEKMPLLKEMNQTVDEINDVQTWFETLLSTNSVLQIDGYHLMVLGKGNSKLTEKATLVCDFQEGIQKAWEHTLKLLWIQGVNFDWEVFYQEGSFMKTRLPGYSFDRQPFRLSPTKKAVEIEPQRGESLHKGLTKSNAQDQTNQDIKILQNEKEDKRQMNTLYAETQNYLKDVLAAELEVHVDELDSETRFEEFGIDSLLIHHFNHRMEQDIGALPKTLLFEYENVKEITEYMVNNHTDELIGFLGLNENEANKVFSTDSVMNGENQAKVNHATISPSPKIRDEDIAIIGVSGRYPKARTLDEFWQILREGQDTVTEVPAVRWRWQDYYDADPNQSAHGKSYSKWGAFLDDVDQFDPLFFHIAPTEADTMDPQERLFIETAWATLEDAGYTPQQLRAMRRGERSANVGVFVGATTLSYLLLGPDLWKQKQDEMIIPTSLPWSIANRVSYLFNFQGPSMPVDTACSASLTAIHLACESIKRGECSSALVGGVNLYLHPSKYVWLSQMRMLSQTGRCHSFGAQGDGFVPGEGVGAVLLKRLSDAVRDGDQIYGVIKGTALNHGGRTNGYTVPNPNAQAELIKGALEESGIDPRTISYVEAHGTGTSLGDPIEVAGLTKAFDHSGEGHQYCALGSVKSNIGHLEAAAGIAGITKILLQMKYKKLVPSLHADKLNPNIEFEKTPFYVQQKFQDWYQPIMGDGQVVPRRAGISSFGAGGSNTHVVIEEYTDQVEQQSKNGQGINVSVLSAQTDEQLQVYARKLVSHLTNHQPSALNVAYTLQIGRVAMEERLAVVFHSLDDLCNKLIKYLDGEANVEGVYRGTAQKLNQKKKGKKNHLQELLDGRDQKEYAEELIESQKFNQLADFWVLGGLVDWEAMYKEGHQPRRISLPTYPFARERYWIPDSVPEQVILKKRSGELQPLHPLVSKNISTLNEYKFMTVIYGDEFFIADHYVGKSRVLPGVVSVEIVRTAAELISAGRNIRKVRNIVLISPIHVKDEPVTLYVSLVPEHEHESLRFEIYSHDEEGLKVLHGQGKVELESRDQVQQAVEWRDIDEIKSRCTKGYKRKIDSYRHLHSIELNLRESFQSIEEIYLGDSEAIAPIHLPPHLMNDFYSFTLHPSIMDGALQVPPAGEMRGAEEMINLPYTVDEIEIIRPLTDRCYSICQLSQTKNGKKPRVPKFDVDITDDKGQVLVKVKGFLARPVEPAEFMKEELSKQDANHPVKEEMRASFKPVWQKESLRKQITRPVGPIILFDRDDYLWRKWQMDVPVILVQPGDSFVQLGERSFKINHSHKEDFYTLMTELEKRDLLPKHIVYLVGETGISFDALTISSQLKSSIYALLYLSQALMKQKPKGPVQLLHIYQTKETVEPLLGAFGGSARTLCLENPKLCYQNISVDERRDLLSVIQNEIQHEPEAGIEVHYDQNDQRWVRRFQQFDIEQELQSEYTWREDGVYLITGGLGGLGVIFAEYIARQAPNTKLVLTGRSELDGKRNETLQGLRNMGVSAHYVQADMSQRHAVHSLIETIKQRFGKINGVIHSAGVIRDAFFIRKKASEMQEVLAPKVFGTLWLDDALRNENIDFFVMFSSSTAVLGNLGQFDYAFANRFMDLFAEWREGLKSKGERNGKSLAINWPLWLGGGMNVDEHSKELLYQRFGMKAMSTEWGLEMFEKGLTYEGSQFMLIEGDPKKVNQVLSKTEQLPEAALKPEQDEMISDSQVTQIVQSINAVAVTSDDREKETDNAWIRLLIQDLIKILSDLLRIPIKGIRAESDLSDYGFDSIKFIDFTNALNKQFDTELTPAVFFEYPSIDSFADFLVEDYAEKLRPYYVSQVTKTNSSHEKVEEQSTVDSGNNQASTDDESQSIDVHKQFIDSEPDKNLLNSIENKSTKSAGKKEARTKEPIAIVGMGGIFPQSDDMDEFWRNLVEGVDCITEIPSDRWDWREYLGDPSKEQNKTNSKWGGFIRNVDKFDAKFFGISPREAELMDPQQRILLEIVWKTIEDAGYKVSDLSRIKTGLYVGASTSDYMELLKENKIDVQAYTTTGNFHSILVNRISYLLNFSGPSFPIDTACSSSLVAIRQAVEGFWNGSCEAAVVAGVNLILTPTIYISFGKAGMLSTDGRCKTFDQSANGYVRSEGAGAVLLKPLSKAIEDNDTIYAVIKGTAVNHGGKVNTLTTPNPNAQASLIMSAFEEGDIDPGTVSYMETHGTGTSLGDPIEVNGLKKAFKELAKRRGSHFPGEAYCGIGSVKTNIGHLEPVAGISGLLKVLLAMRYKTLPASINLTEQNPYIQLDGSPFYIVKESQPWKALRDQQDREFPRRAGVSSFGFGGVNAHVILEEFHQPNEIQHESDDPQLFVFSAKNHERLEAYVQKWLDFLKEKEYTTFGISTMNKNRSIERELVQLAADVIDVNDQDIHTDEPLVEIGFDLVNLSVFLGRINQQYHLNLSANRYTDFPTIEDLASEVAELLNGQPAEKAKEGQGLSLRNMAYTLQVGREEMEERVAFVASSREELMRMLSYYINRDQEVDIYTGNISEYDQNHVGLLLDGREGEQFLQTILQEKKWSKIAQLWVSGVKIDWKFLHKGQSVRRLSLPTYPFARDSHWFKKVKKNQQTTKDKEFGRLQSDQKQFEFNQTLYREDKLINDHIIDGRPLLPGVGYLEFVMKSAENAIPQEHMTLEQVIWLKPLVVNNKQKIRTVLTKQEPGLYKFEVLSEPDEGKVITHATGYVTNKELHSSQPDEISLHDAIDRTTTRYDQQTIYQLFKERGLAYGHYFQGIQELWVSEQEAVARLQLPQEYVKELEIYQLQPTLMDSALQTIAGQITYQDTSNQQTILPFAVDGVEWLRPLQAESFVYAKALENGRFNVYVTDIHGQVAVRMKDIMVHVSRKKSPEPINLENFFYETGWKQKTLAAYEKQLAEVNNSQSILIVTPRDTKGVDQEIAKHHQRDLVHYLKLDEQIDWENSLSLIPRPDVIYFLGGIQTHQVNTAGDALELLNVSQEQGVMGLYHLIRTMSRIEWMQKKIVLKVITNDVHAIDRDERIYPLSASLFGLTMTVAKEYANLQVSCIDLTLHDSIFSQLPYIFAEPPHPNGECIAIRNGKRYVYHQQPVDIPPVSSTAFKKRGVYFIVGGSGGIGLTLSQYLAENVQARLVLIGRSALTEKQKQQIKHVESVGGEVMYYRADVTSYESLRKAKEEAINRFGHINGVIHAAIVLKDRILDWMDNESFSQVLRPKVEGSIHLHKVFSGDSLDFMLFFSSAQSFTGSPGQSNYAAASTFMDAYARTIDQQEDYPVHVINWGFWGTVGVVANQDYRDRLAKQGFHSIQPKEGMEALERILAHSSKQVLAIKAEKRVIEGMNGRVSAPVRDGVSIAQQLDIRGYPNLNQHIPPLGINEHSIKAFEELLRFSQLLLLDFFQSQGIFCKLDERYEIEVLRQKLAVSKENRCQFHALISLLEKRGFVTFDGDFVTSTAQVENQAVQETLLQLEERIKKVVNRYPEVSPHFRLLQTCMNHFIEILRGDIPSTTIIFPNSSTELVESIYQGSYYVDYCNQLVAQTVRAYIEEKAAQLVPGEKLKILEVGAGTGGTSRCVLNEIAVYQSQVEYVYTDISAGFTRLGKRKYGEKYRFASFKTLDISVDIEKQGFVKQEFDIVIAANVLHATSNIRDSLTTVRQLLKPNGWLLLNEVTEVQEFHTLTFGLLKGWWLFEDEEVRMKDSPLLSPGMWEQALSETCFMDIAILSGHKDLNNPLPQNVIVAKSGVPEQVVYSPEANEQSTKLFIQNAIVEQLAESLGMNPDEINLKQSFSSYGVDSIVSVELVNQINESLGIVLRTIAIFDYPNIKELTDFIYKTFANELTHTQTDINKSISEQEIALGSDVLAAVSQTGSTMDQNEIIHPVQTLSGHEVQDYIENTIIQQLAESLGEQTNAISLKKDFSSYGVDSIVGVELINRLNDAFQIVLRTIVIFDYPNVKELTSYIYEEFGEKISSLIQPENIISERSNKENELMDLLNKLEAGELDLEEVNNRIGG